MPDEAGSSYANLRVRLPVSEPRFRLDLNGSPIYPYALDYLRLMLARGMPFPLASLVRASKTIYKRFPVRSCVAVNRVSDGLMTDG